MSSWAAQEDRQAILQAVERRDYETADAELKRVCGEDFARDLLAALRADVERAGR